jgi:hypothetical protein
LTVWLALLAALLISCGGQAATPAPTATPQAATTCPALVEEALAAVDAQCSGTARNQVCYGNSQLSVTPNEGVTGLAFEKPGDMVGLEQVQALRLSPMDAAASVWGVALLRVQANLPDTLPGQNVTLLLFGDVELEQETSGERWHACSTSAAGLARLRRSPGSGILVPTRARAWPSA